MPIHWYWSWLLILPFLAWLKGRWGQRASFVYSSVDLVRPVFGLSESPASRVLAALRWLALAVFIVALSQPRFVHGETQIKASGVDIVVCIDSSPAAWPPEDFTGGRPSRKSN